MQTPAILNISNPASGPSASAKSASGAPNDGFNKMLSQQLADRRDADRLAQARQAGQTGKCENKQPEAGAPATKQPESQQVADNNKPGSSKAAGTRDNDDQTDEAAGMPPTATELMTQVAASLLPPQAAAEASATAVDAITGANGIALARDQGLLANADLGKQLAGAATGAQAEFQADLRQATGAQDASLQAAIADTVGNEKLAALAAATDMQDASPLTMTGAAMQAGVLSASHAAGAEAMDHLTPRFGSPAWDQALGQKVVWMVAGAQQSASLTLNPPDLGPLQVVLNVSNGQADASFFAAQPEVRQALEAALPKLRDMMSEAGVTLGQASVSAGMPDRHNQPGSQTAHKSNSGTSGGNGAVETAAVPVTRTGRMIGGQGLVDTFA